MQITIDTKLKLLAGLPIMAEDFYEINPLTLREIIHHGFTNYMNKLNILSIKKEQLLESMNPDFVKELPHDVNEFDLLFTLADDDLQILFKESLEFFLKDEITLFPKEQFMIVGNDSENLKIIHRKNYNNISEIIQLQNYVISVDGNLIQSPKDEKAKIVKERMIKAKEEVKRIKAKEHGEYESDFFDLVSAISSKSNSLNLIDVLDLTIFQVYEEFKRLNFIDQYLVNIQAMIQGAKNIKLQHWSNKIT